MTPTKFLEINSQTIIPAVYVMPTFLRDGQSPVGTVQGRQGGCLLPLAVLMNTSSSVSVLGLAEQDVCKYCGEDLERKY
jgi:hypothetical protein